ncbi:elongation factor EF-2 [Candidatus Woesearchaeota archaeon]|nr:elongation factor EF-2 [Candidatus Woesearchaeota archaeon]MBW3014620.1 elongation factor EF-2 [Candidatus Woesearchaeota archaeon]
MTERVLKLMNKPTHIRNIAVSAHIDHGKTTFSDNLLAGAGMMSEELAGKQLALDFKEDEQARGITIDAANVSMVHTYDGEEYLINLIDTPGHVDFGGDVTRAMRAVDGTIVVVCAVEGMMPQTETVLRQALKEKDKPILFINKMDRLIKELQLTPEQMQERLIKIITKVNKFVSMITEGSGLDWNLSVQDGSVCFGSAFHNWGLSMDYMKKKNISFKDVYDAYNNDTWKELAKKAPIHEVVLGAVIKHLPNPLTAQKYRIPQIWHGDVESTEGKALATCDPKGPAAFIVIKVVVDKHAGEVCAGRLFSGTINKGDTVYLNLAKKNVRVQQVNLYKGAQRIQVDGAVAGNIVGLVGLGEGGRPGETVSTNPITPFEAITHIFEPVVTKAIEAARPSDLPKLIEVLRQVNKEDPSIVIEINESTGEHLMSGMGELHLEVIENRIKTEKGIDVKTSPPIVVYREAVLRKNPTACEGKSPNKHNKLYFYVEPLEPEVREAIKLGKLQEGRIKKKDQTIVDTFRDLGYDTKTAGSVKDIYNGNIFIDATRGIVQIGEIMEMLLDMFEDVMRAGPLAREPCIGVKVIFDDCKLHEDAIHRGPGQMYPAVREGIRGAMAMAAPVLFEPIQQMQFVAPAEYMGELSKLVSNKRGQLLDMQQEGDEVTVIAKLPVAEMFGLSNDLRSATGGRGSQSLVDQTFERLPGELQGKVIAQLKQRKGLGEKETL